MLYYDYIARYVEDGGALLVAAGPGAGRCGIDLPKRRWRPSLPAVPTGAVTEAGYYPRHRRIMAVVIPVTRTLPGALSEPPDWGRWFRTVSVGDTAGDVVMRGAANEPLLVLNRYGEGRVATAPVRITAGSGPAALKAAARMSLFMRRIAHWLMKEPSLEEEALRATANGRTLVIERQTMSDTTDPATIELPSGETRRGHSGARRGTDCSGRSWRSTSRVLSKSPPGICVRSPMSGRSTHPSSVQPSRPLASSLLSSAETGGLTTRVNATASNLPQILPTRSARIDAGERMGLRASNESVLKGVRSVPLFGGFLGLALMILALGATWFREGR